MANNKHSAEKLRSFHNHAIEENNKNITLKNSLQNNSELESFVIESPENTNMQKISIIKIGNKYFAKTIIKNGDQYEEKEIEIKNKKKISLLNNTFLTLNPDKKVFNLNEQSFFSRHFLKKKNEELKRISDIYTGISNEILETKKDIELKSKNGDHYKISQNEVGDYEVFNQKTNYSFTINQDMEEADYLELMVIGQPIKEESKNKVISMIIDRENKFIYNDKKKQEKLKDQKKLEENRKANKKFIQASKKTPIEETLKLFGSGKINEDIYEENIYDKKSNEQTHKKVIPNDKPLTHLKEYSKDENLELLNDSEVKTRKTNNEFTHQTAQAFRKRGGSNNSLQEIRTQMEGKPILPNKKKPKHNTI